MLKNGVYFIYLLFLLLCYIVDTNPIVIVYDDVYKEDIIQIENNSDFTFYNIDNLNKLQQASFTTLHNKQIVLSFTKSYRLLETSFPDHYGFSTSLKDLHSITPYSGEKLCLQFTNSFLRTLQFTILSISKRDIAFVTDESYCSKELLRKLKTNIEVYSKNFSYEFMFHNISVSETLTDNSELGRFFYQLKTVGISLIIILTPEKLYTTIFKLASWYDMTSRLTTWLIPYYPIDLQIANLPNELITFRENSQATSYTNISGLIHSLNVTHTVASSTCHNESYPTYKSCITERLYYTLSNHDVICKESVTYVELKYRSLIADNSEWLTSTGYVADDKLLLHRNDIPIIRSVSGITDRRSLRAVTILAEPFTMITREINNDEVCTEGLKCLHLNQTSCCVGFLMDLFKGIMSETNIDVDLHIVNDGNYGVIKDGKWNGLVGEVLRNEADIAVASLTITNKRLGAIDFTMPYAEETMGILVLPEIEKLDFINWKFVSPLDAELQLALWFLGLVAVVVIFLFENNVYAASLTNIGKTKKVKYYGIIECMTYVAGVFLQRDLGGKNPRRLGARVLSIVYAFGMVIFITTYTAVLAAQSVQNIEVNPFTGSNDERIQNPDLEFKYGVQTGSAYETLFDNGQTEKMMIMNRFMVSNHLNYKNISDGINKLASNELQAMLGDYTGLRYWLSKDSSCARRLVKDSLFQSGLGFGIKKNFPWKSLIDQTLLKFKDQEIVTEMQKKWFNEICQPEFFVTQKKELSMLQFSGLIFLLVATMLISFPLLLPEIIYYKFFRNKLSDWMKYQLIKRKKIHIFQRSDT